MPALPKLLGFEEVDNEKRWTYPLKTYFNYQQIYKLTITDYIWKNKKGREMITKELVWNLFQEKLHEEELMKPIEYGGNRKPYMWDKFYRGKWYRAYFWHENNSTSHLWVRNFHRIDPPKTKTD